jgi:O-antigen/teichoic acid export membrane protein
MTDSETLAIRESLNTEVAPVSAGWRPLLRGAGLIGIAAVASGVLSAVATKIFAAMLGPAELAVLATLQQIRQGGLTVATLNGQTALVQGLSARSGRERREFLRTVLLLMTMAMALMAAAAWIAPGWLASATGLGAERAPLIRWLALAVALSCVLVFLSAVLNARSAIGGLALVQLASPGTMAVLAYPMARTVQVHQEGALVAWLVAAASVAIGLALVVLWRQSIRHWFRGDGRWWSAPAARGFLTISGAMLASGTVASLVLLSARSRILHRQGFIVAGQFDAAWAISMNHVSLVLASLQTCCLPVLARISSRTERGAHLNRMLTSAAVAATAAVCAIALLKPVIVTWLYSESFRDAATYLRWTLVGDYLKVSSWVLSIPMLASAEMRLFLTADLGAYAMFAGGTAVASYFRGAAEGTAIAFVLMYAAHLGITGTIAWLRYGFRPGHWTTLIWTSGLLAVVAASAATWEAR